ncbi:MAG: TonB C-terminal domain-containing protein [Desulfomonilia bacterium]|jgi:outer membrane biosynthesis protein TonB
MKRLGRYAGISFLAHLLLIFSLVDMDFSSQNDPSPYDVYEIDIVTPAPSSAGAAKGGAAPARASGQKKYFYRKGSEQSALSGISKEKALPGQAPELSPEDLEPLVERDDRDLEEDIAPPASAGSTALGGSGAQAAGSASAVAAWKARVRAVVDSMWKTPPEISVMDASLTTTYLLKVSRTGELLDKKLLVSSGNGPFDRSVHLALSNVTSLPQPPIVLIAGRDSVEVTMSFTPPKGVR